MNRVIFFFALSIVFLFSSCTKEEITPQADNLMDLTESLETRASTDVGFRIGKAMVISGQVGCVDVSVKNFNNIVGTQYSLAWDSDVLAFSHVTNFGLPGLSATNFANPSADRMTTAWFNPDLTGVTLSNNSAIYSVCFTAVGSFGDETSIDLVDNPTTVEIIDGDFNTLGYRTKSGRIKVK